jgi:fructokinase
VILVIGEILFDLFPNYKRLGGAPFNFAYHLKNFGFNVRFISRIGMDDAGKEILHKLELAQFNLDDIQVDEVHPTGSVNVQLDKRGGPRFDIISDVAYDYLDFIPEYHSILINTAQMVYFGTLVQRSKAGCENLQEFISHNEPEALNFYDINLRPGCYSNVIIEKSLSKTDILKLNSEELDKLRQMLFLNMNKNELVDHLMEKYSISSVSLTKGESGSELFTEQGCFDSEPAEAITVVDSVGAGDAYAAMLAAGLLKNWRPEEILERALLFASRVCEIKGAIPESASFYEPFKALIEDN